MNKPEFFGIFSNSSGCYSTVKIEYASSIVVYHFYCKNKETINEAEHKASSKSHREFILISRLKFIRYCKNPFHGNLPMPLTEKKKIIQSWQAKNKKFRMSSVSLLAKTCESCFPFHLKKFTGEHRTYVS